MVAGSGRIELRKNPRNITTSKVTCRSRTIPAISGGPISETGTLLDLAPDGAGLLLSHPFRPDEVVSLDGIDDGRGPREASVRWIRKTDSHYRVGVAFHPESDATA